MSVEEQPTQLDRIERLSLEIAKAPQYPPEDRKWHRLLDSILHSGNETGIRAIKGDLEVIAPIALRLGPMSSEDVTRIAELERRKP